MMRARPPVRSLLLMTARPPVSSAISMRLSSLAMRAAERVCNDSAKPYPLDVS